MRAPHTFIGALLALALTAPAQAANVMFEVTDQDGHAVADADLVAQLRQQPLGQLVQRLLVVVADQRNADSSPPSRPMIASGMMARMVCSA